MLHGLWRIELFGRLRALNADRRIDRFRTEKTGVLLAYLAYFGDRAHTRELLADMLWPAARIGAAVLCFWWIRGHAEEGLRWLQPVNDSGRNVLDSNLLGRALHAAGTLAWASNQMNEAEVFHREALSVRRECGDLDGAARSLGSLGNALRERGDNATAYDCYQESLELFRKLGDWRFIARSLLNLGTIAEDTAGDLPARAYYAESLALYRDLGDKHSIAMSLFNLANVLCNLSEYDAASDLLRECI
jgi:tetratricopeptide (TPR) repeat protein